MLKAIKKYRNSSEFKKRSEKYKTGRRLRFETEYLKNNGNALDAALKAGYSKSYSIAFSYGLAKDVNVSLARVARAKGYTEHKLIDKYGQFLESKQEKIQLEATRDLCEIIEPRQSQTSFGASVGHGKDGRPTLQVILQHSVSRPDRSKQAVKTLNIPVNGSAHADDD